ncbi:protein TRICHOME BIREFRINGENCE-LIKE 30 [Hibiscus syriacus]|uniref:Protein TRICHOME BIREFRINGENCE-LIKE 30 n=1 Tax=Hibiscus syriacus TaxID=106335 RepID=A0A6A3ACA0_HIBSY|nr:protein TRICHOME BIREFRINGENCE-LIKE 30 [Hibiscus syriacus]
MRKWRRKRRVIVQTCRPKSSTVTKPPPPPSPPPWLPPQLPPCHIFSGAASKTSTKAPAEFKLGANPPEWLNGTMMGDRGFDPFGLGKPAEYLQFYLDSLNQNLAKIVAGEVIGVINETTEVKPTPFRQTWRCSVCKGLESAS